MNKVLIIVGDATETVDTLYPIFRLQEDAFEPVVAGLKSGNITWYCMRFHPTGMVR